METFSHQIDKVLELSIKAGIKINTEDVYLPGNVLINLMALNYGSGPIKWVVKVLNKEGNYPGTFTAELLEYSPDKYNIHSDRIGKLDGGYIKGYWDIYKQNN